jgi:hypothetical protein
MTIISRRDRRALILGLSFVSAAFLWIHALPRYRAWVSELREIAWLAEADLQRLRLMLGETHATADSLAAARELYLALAPRLLTGESAAASGSALMALVSGAVDRPGLVMGTLQASGDSAAGRHFLRVAVRGDFTGDITALTEFIRAMESDQVRLAFRELAVDQADPAAPGDRAEALRVRFIVEGISLRREGEKDR